MAQGRRLGNTLPQGCYLRFIFMDHSYNVLIRVEWPMKLSIVTLWVSWTLDSIHMTHKIETTLVTLWVSQLDSGSDHSQLTHKRESNLCKSVSMCVCHTQFVEYALDICCYREIRFIIISIISISSPSSHICKRRSLMVKQKKANTKLCIIALRAVSSRKLEYIIIRIGQSTSWHTTLNRWSYMQAKYNTFTRIPPKSEEQILEVYKWYCGPVGFVKYNDNLITQHSELFDSHKESAWLTKKSQSIPVSQLIVWDEWSLQITKKNELTHWLLNLDTGPGHGFVSQLESVLDMSVPCFYITDNAKW